MFAINYIQEYMESYSDEIVFTDVDSFYKNITLFDDFKNDKNTKRKIIHKFMYLAYQYRNSMKKWEFLKKRPNIIAEDAVKAQNIYFKTLEIEDDGYIIDDKLRKYYADKVTALYDDAHSPKFAKPTKKSIEDYLRDIGNGVLSRKAKELKDSI